MLSIPNYNIYKKVMATLFFTYLIILLWIVIFKCNQNQYLHIAEKKDWTLKERIEPYPFKKWIDAYKEGYFSKIEFIAFIFNFICFLPFGALLRFFTDKSWLVITIGSVFCVGIEVFQILSRWGGLEYTDIVMTILGVVCGVWIYDFLRPRMSEKLINIIAVCSLCCSLPLSVFTVINTINNFPV